MNLSAAKTAETLFGYAALSRYHPNSYGIVKLLLNYHKHLSLCVTGRLRYLLLIHDMKMIVASHSEIQLRCEIRKHLVSYCAPSMPLTLLFYNILMAFVNCDL